MRETKYVKRVLPLPLLSLVIASLAQADAQEVFRREDLIDDIGVARVAAEAGDSALEQALRMPTSRDVVLAASRAAAYADAPERLVPALVELALSRDPQLAEEASQALTATFARLTERELSEREVLLEDVRRACAAFAKLPAAKAPRADLRLALEAASARCDALAPAKG